jgi:AcrR family transcriptional regulator
LKRRYQQRKRAEAAEATRRRIVEAAVSMHTTIGPARTSLSAVAKKAGVSRPTLYRHFPDLPSLFMACSAHGMAADPLPDPSAWTAVAPPRERLLRGLADLYGYYRRNRGINAHMARDTELIGLIEGEEPPSVAAGPHPEARVLRLMAQMQPMMDARNRMVAETLAAPWREAGRATRELESALAVVIRFDTWKTLALEHGLDDGAAARIAATMVEALARTA